LQKHGIDEDEERARRLARDEAPQSADAILSDGGGDGASGTGGGVAKVWQHGDRRRDRGPADAGGVASSAASSAGHLQSPVSAASVGQHTAQSLTLARAKEEAEAESESESEAQRAAWLE
jgi:hypothetical protein